MSATRLVVTGSGLVARSAIEAAIEADLPVVCFASRPPEGLVGGSVEHVPGRLGLGAFADVIRAGDAVACCHGLANPRMSVEDFERYSTAMAAATAEVVAAVAAVEGVRVAVASSGGSVYGPSTVPAVESLPASPQTYYGSLKVAEEALYGAIQCSGTAATILRISTLYGPVGGEGRAQGLVNAAATRIVKGEPVPVFRDGLARRGYLHVDDLGRIVVRLLTTPNLDHQVYNVCSGEYRTALDVVASIGRSLGVEPSIESIDRADVDVLVDPSRLYDEFPDLRPTRGFERGIQAAVADLVAK